MEINVRAIFKEKNPKLARLLPGFIFRYIEKVIHQDEVNCFQKMHGDKTGTEYINAAMEYFNVKVEIIGLENIPKEGRYLFASNHPLGGFDGIILMKYIAENFGNVKVLANDILMNIKNLAPFFLPINKHGHQSKDSVNLIENAFAANEAILTFPAGLCSRKINGTIIDLEWKKSFISKALESKRDIVPIHFNGKNSPFFYNLSNIRKKLGIKANIEMVYLVDELFKHRNGKFTITFGSPIPYVTFDKSLSHKEWAAKLKEQVYKLKENPNSSF